MTIQDDVKAVRDFCDRSKDFDTILAIRRILDRTERYKTALRFISYDENVFRNGLLISERQIASEALEEK